MLMRQRSRHDRLRRELVPLLAAPFPMTVTERAFAEHELAAIVWHELSPFRNERGLAASRYRQHVERGLDPDAGLSALAEFAAGRDRTGKPFHAYGFTERVARERSARIREHEYAALKNAHNAVSRSGSLNHLSAALAAVLSRLGAE